MSAFLKVGGSLVNLDHVTAVTTNGENCRLLLRGSVAFVDLDVTVDEFVEALAECAEVIGSQS